MNRNIWRLSLIQAICAVIHSLRWNRWYQPPMCTPEQQSVEALWLKAVRHVMENTEDVGERFAEEARRIHYGESEERGIRGQASAEDTEALLDEGIPVLPLPVPKALKGPVQ